MRKLLCIGLLAVNGLFSVNIMHAQNKDNLTLFVGTAQPTAESGIYVYEFNQNDASSDLKKEVSGIANPTYLAIGKDGKYLYSVSEMGDSESSLVAYSYNSADWSLKFLNSQKTKGASPCYVWVSQDNTLAATANYTGGSVSLFPIAPDGTLQEVELIQYSGGNPQSERQSRPHLHSIYSTPDNNYLLANDLGTDRVYNFKLHKEKAGSTTAEYIKNNTFQLAEAEGPRHTAFHPNKKYAYIIGELSGNVTVLKYNKGQLFPIQSIKADTLNASGSADIHITPNGRFLYASNRLKGDGLAIFRIDPSTGKLTKIGYQQTGIHPRNFVITPNGKYLLCACRDSNIIDVFKIDQRTGLLEATNKKIEISKPMCLKFLQNR